MANSSPAPVHAGTKRPLTIDDQDEDVRIAVKALGDMRSRAVAHARAPSAEAFAAVAKAHSRASSASQSTPLLTHSSTSASTSASSPISPQSSLASEPHPNEEISAANLDVSNEDFVSRVSHLPIVNTALKAYDYSKERSRVVKYGANLMESSVKTISRPVIDRLPVGQLDDFACRQLDRLGYPKSNTPEASTNDAPRTQFLEYAYREPLPQSSRETSRAPSVAPSGTDDYLPQDPPAGSPERHTTKPRDSSREENKDQNDKQVASRSKWQAMLLEAGGIGAAVSEESMKRLQYCLQWLQYATAHIDSQIALLRSFIDSLSPQPPHQNDPQALVPLQTMRSLTDVRRDVVSTIRQVVDVISQYAGGALPEPARASVRAVILRLPTRWANANQDASAAQPGAQQQPSSGPNRIEAQEASAPIPPHMRPTAGRGTHPTASTATRTAQRILTLATESLDMMRSITAVFKESLDRAEAWVERLRVVGIQRQGALLPPPSQPSSPSAGHTVGREEETSPPNIQNDAQPPPPSPSISLSSSMHSLTSLSIATQATSPPTSVAGGSRPFFRPGNGEDDAEGETETEEDDGTPRQDPDASVISKDDKDEGRKQNMDVDG